MKMSRATNSLLKVIKIGSIVFFKTEQRTFDYEIKLSRATHSLLKVIQIGSSVFFKLRKIEKNIWVKYVIDKKKANV